MNSDLQGIMSSAIGYISPRLSKNIGNCNIFDFSLFLVFHYWQLYNVNIAAWWWCEYWEKLPYYNSNCTKVRDKLVRESYKTSMGPLTLCHFCLTPIYTYTMVEEILENPQLDFWWFLVRCSSWRRLNLWPWNISSLCCWYSVHFVLCEVWRWCTIENRFIKKSLGSADTWMKKTSLGIEVYMLK